MSTSIDTAFVREYESTVHNVFQRKGSLLRRTVRTKENVAGKSTTFQKVGTGVATTKARHGTITPMNQTHTAIECSLSDFYAGDWVDALDEVKTNIDEQEVVATGGAGALGRKVDDQLVTVFDATTQTVVTWVVSSAAAIRNSLLQMVEALDGNDVPNDGQRYGLLTPRAWSMAATVEEFSSADYVGATGMTFTEGAAVQERWKSWMGVLWKQHSGLPGKGTSTAKVFTYHKTAAGYASGKKPANLKGSMSGDSPVGADISWHGDRAAHFVNHAMSGGACLIDDAGVIEGNLDDTAAIPTS